MSRGSFSPTLIQPHVAAARARIPSLLHGRRFEVIEATAEPTHLRAVRGSQ